MKPIDLGSRYTITSDRDSMLRSVAAGCGKLPHLTWDRIWTYFREPLRSSAVDVPLKEAGWRKST